MTLAEASGAAIIGFNVRANKEAREAAEQAGIEIRYYNIIYNLVDDVKDAMSGLLAPTLRETLLGNAQILEVFKVSKVGNIAGCRVTDGTVERGANVRLIRDNVVVHEGKLSQLKRFKDDVARSGRRTGMRHGLRELPGHEGRRRYRMLSGGDGAAIALSPNLRRRTPPIYVMPAKAGSSNPGENIEARRLLDHPLSRMMTLRGFSWHATSIARAPAHRRNARCASVSLCAMRWPTCSRAARCMTR